MIFPPLWCFLELNLLTCLNYDKVTIVSLSVMFISLFRNDDSRGNRIGFASQLGLLVKALDLSLDAQFMEDFVSGL